MTDKKHFRVHRRLLDHRCGNAPFNHRDLHGIVHDEARDHGIDENRERLRPGQRHESRESHARQNGARESFCHEGYQKGLTGQRCPESVALTSGHYGEHGKIK